MMSSLTEPSQQASPFAPAGGLFSAPLQPRERPAESVLEDVSFRTIDHGSAVDRAVVITILREYFASVGGEDATRRYRWLYAGQPHGVARSYVAFASRTGVPVAITSLFPRAVQIGHDRAMGAIGGDAFVTPRFRRRGLATALHRLALAGLNRDLSFMFGPPEPNNLRALLSAGARVTGAVRKYTRPLRARGLGEFAGRHPSFFDAALAWLTPPSSLKVEPLGETPDHRVDAVWQGVADAAAKSGAVIPVRDAEFYAWRFGQSVSRRQRPFVVLDGGRPIAAAALERSRNRFAIVDVTCEPERFKDVMRALIGVCHDADVVDIQIHVPSRRKEASLASLGFVPRSRKPFQVQSQASFSHRRAVNQASAWEYTWGDGDVDHVL